MTEAEWQVCADVQLLLASLGGRAGERKLRLFACACVRQGWDALTSPAARAAVEAAEGFADGRVARPALRRARLRVAQTLRDLYREAKGGRAGDSPSYAEVYALQAVWRVASERDYLDAVPQMRAAVRLIAPGGTADQADLLRDVLGPLPFRPVDVDPAWLAWNYGTVPAIARRIDHERAFHDLPILADALEDAGCQDPEWLEHCRGGGVHVRGCWVVDRLLNRR